MREWSNSEALDLLPAEETEAPPPAAAAGGGLEVAVVVVGSAPPRMVVDSIMLDEGITDQDVCVVLWMVEVWQETRY